MLLLSLALIAGCIEVTGPDGTTDAGPPRDSNGKTAQEREAQVAEFLAGPVEAPERSLPVVRSQASYQKYLNLFRDVCLRRVPSFSGSREALLAAGFRQVPTNTLEPDILGDTRTSSEAFKGMHPEYQKAALKLRNADGSVPYIRGFYRTGSSLTNKYTNGIIVATVSTERRAQNNVCAISIKAPDDSPLLRELGRVANETGLASGPPTDTGFLGAGYMVPKSPANGGKPLVILLGRSSRSEQAHTYIHVGASRK